ncbi:MAG: 3-isopropylmalate dehydratase small subunit [Bacillota bacterium]|nr:3-isopropylmalate dehydratase small subunit [Bacillota bacterium]
MIMQGRIFKFGDDIDTDAIIPARYLVTTDIKTLASYCFEEVSPAFAKEVQEGDIIVGGSNFGCGSSREQAVVAIVGNGVRVILAESFARIFYRNCINRGIYALEIPSEAVEQIHDGETISMDLEKGEITTAQGALPLKFTPISEDMRRIVEAGGIIPYTKAQLATK